MIVGDVVKSLLAAGLMVLAAAPFIVGIIVVANGWVEFYVPVCLLIVAAAIVIAGERIARSLRARR
ncbi:hypothetical protein [Tsukamurella paurometabola]|uniref:hypothetical protein n=1 Tax=Tsukamurella paurometabola TaxID=2061 RepID=UPI00019F0CE6|nr:hypothetical protein [Tsukamurella paurometabola]